MCPQATTATGLPQISVSLSDLLVAGGPPGLWADGAGGQAQMAPSLLQPWLCVPSGAPGLWPLLPSPSEAQSTVAATRASAPSSLRAEASAIHHGGSLGRLC